MFALVLLICFRDPNAQKKGTSISDLSFFCHSARDIRKLSRLQLHVGITSLKKVANVYCFFLMAMMSFPRICKKAA